MPRRNAAPLLVGAGALALACNAVLKLEDVSLAPDAEVGGEGGNGGADDGMSGASTGEGGSAGETTGPGGAAGVAGTGGAGGASGEGGASAGEAGSNEEGGGEGGAGASCSNGNVDPAEACDDGNDDGGDGCDPSCDPEPGWTCDAASPSECTPVCGDGEVLGSETLPGRCDDGDASGGDGCDAECAVEAGWFCSGQPSMCTESCGNAELDSQEECDDGDLEPGDGCDACIEEAGWSCAGAPSICETTCGDGVPAGTEECDDGESPTQDCDYGEASCLVCNSSCESVAGLTRECGDGTIDESYGETCDQGNTMAGDGCSASCTVESEWTCTMDSPSLCTPTSSCAGMTGTECQGESCCVSPLVTGGTFEQGEPNQFKSTVSSFRLDKYEVTVGRFRRFVSAYDDWRASNPASGDGAHPEVAGSGWRTDWDASLPASAAGLAADLSDGADPTWLDDSGNDLLPINYVGWYDAFAFCLWDGGRLPTEAEWEYAAVGGNNDTEYPWGSTPAPDSSRAVYGCLGDGSVEDNCAFSDILPVGSKPAGQGLYGQRDLAGSMWEWVLDWYDSYPTGDVSNYANVDSGSGRGGRGGDWVNSNIASLAAANRGYAILPFAGGRSRGIRCARDP